MNTRSMLCALAAVGLQCATSAHAQGNFNVENNTVPQEWTNRAKEGAPAQSQAEVDYRERQAAIRDPRPADRRDWRSRNPQPGYPRGDRPGSGYGPGSRMGPTPTDGVYRPGGRGPPGAAELRLRRRRLARAPPERAAARVSVGAERRRLSARRCPDRNGLAGGARPLSRMQPVYAGWNKVARVLHPARAKATATVQPRGLCRRPALRSPAPRHRRACFSGR